MVYVSTDFIWNGNYWFLVQENSEYKLTEVLWYETNKTKNFWRFLMTLFHHFKPVSVLVENDEIKSSKISSIFFFCLVLHYETSRCLFSDFWSFCFIFEVFQCIQISFAKFMIVWSFWCYADPIYVAFVITFEHWLEAVVRRFDWLRIKFSVFYIPL